MKWFAILSALSITAANARADDPAQPPKGLTVHEWGVFRVCPDSDFANAELRAEWDKLPPFVYGFIKGRVVPQHWGAPEPRARPLIFFHTDKPATATVRVSFPGGMPGVWYPATSQPSIEGFQKQPRIGSSLEWTVGIKTPPNGWVPRTPTPAEVADDNWFAMARKVKCDEIYAKFGPNRNDVEREKFIYYDGIFPADKWLKIAVDGDKVSLMNQVAHPVFDVTVVDRRSAKPRIGRIDKIDTKETVARVEWVDADASKFAADASRKLTSQLRAAGLFEDEAKLLVDCWKTDLFERPGLHVFYRIPQSVYDVKMPLTVTPKPQITVRVGLIFHGHVEPDFADRILELVKQLDSERFADRDAATRKLLEIGPAALAQIQKYRDRKGFSVELRERIDALIKKWNAKDAFDP
jgi:hypothetical protein